MAKKVLIIGGGVAGLSAGCYARMNGYEAEIHESHTIPGGLCTTWKRGRYLFDGSLEWLVGSAASSPFHKYWREVGALAGTPILDREIFYQFLGRDGRRLCFYADADRLERHLVELSPGDAEPAAHLRRLVKAFASRSLLPDKPMELLGPLDIARLILGMLPVMKEMGYAQKTTTAEFAAKFKDPLIRDGLQISLALPECSLLSLVATLADFHNHAAGFPKGGSLELSRRIEARYLALGGRVEYRSKVARILVENGKAVGAALADGREVRADYVIGAADLHENGRDPPRRRVSKSGPRRAVLQRPVVPVRRPGITRGAHGHHGRKQRGRNVHRAARPDCHWPVGHAVAPRQAAPRGLGACARRVHGGLRDRAQRDRALGSAARRPPGILRGEETRAGRRGGRT